MDTSAIGFGYVPHDLYGRHTGVMWMQRQGAGVECMQRWREILLSGKFSTDQQSLDEAEALGETHPPDGTPYTLKARV